MPTKTKKPSRIQIEAIGPELDCGRFPVKRSVGDQVVVSADIFCDGHESLAASLRYRGPSSRSWTVEPLEPLGNDRYAGAFHAPESGRWRFVIEAWLDRAATWRDELRRKVDAGQIDLAAELAEGEALLGRPLTSVDEGLASTEGDRHDLARSPPFAVDVDRERARFGAWYELFPRSFGGFAGVERVLPRLAELGFDVVYLPPIHPIGRSERKGRNNTSPAEPGDVGSPWAIGSIEGGHDAIHPELGTIDDFDSLVASAQELGLEIALDLALQCSPDHPWLTEHPEWFRWRPDGTVKYAENPPKRYQDIVNFDWETEDRKGLWAAIREIVVHWVSHGVRAFRVDNPHTKPLAFWEWLIADIREHDPDVIFLAEAFTRPAMMRALAKAGFNQSYTYFTWKNTRAELTAYVSELAGEMAEYYRPNFFANTPDILHEYLQTGGRPAFEARLVLAATLSPSYGIYSGFERCENVPLRPGSEEYLDSEKFELKPGSVEGPLVPLIKALNEIRRANRSLQQIDNVTFLETANDVLIAYAKRSESDAIVVCVNLDPHAPAEGVVEIPASLGLPAAFSVQDLLTGVSFAWALGRNYVQLGPGQAHLLHVR